MGLVSFIPVVIFIITAVSNGANTDGIDGLAAGTSTISVLALGIFTFLSGILYFQVIIIFYAKLWEMTVLLQHS
jgi:phospho-N-acetylmuramoyl-pentapeptide-transferase